MHAKAERKCLDCGKTLTGHSNPKRCLRCAARHRYIDIYGAPPERIITNCAVCGMEIVDYKTNRIKGNHGIHLCSKECRGIWNGVVNSIQRGGDGLQKKKSEKDKIYYRRKSDEIRKKRKKFYQENRDRLLAGLKAKSRTLKKQVLEHYGGECECCGEIILEFLTIDHIHNDGHIHRAELKGKGIKVYADIVKNGFPEGRFRVLCFNCNISRGFYGYCPHKPDEKFEYSRVPKNPGRKRTVK